MPLIQETATPADGKPAVDSYVTIPFGSASTQLGHVEGYTRTGKVKVRAWNASRSRWMPNTRTLTLDQIIGRRDNLPAHIPAPVAAGGGQDREGYSDDQDRDSYYTE